jgi:hypothetical protein
VVASFANVAAANQATTGERNAEGQLIRTSRGVPTIMPEQLYGWTSRLPKNRYNPYPAPGALNGIGREGMRSLGCDHIHNVERFPGGLAPPCLVQQPWNFQGRRASYPRLRRFRPAE